MTTKHKLSLLAGTAIALAASQAQAQTTYYGPYAQSTAPIAGNVCNDGTTTGGYNVGPANNTAVTVCNDVEVTNDFTYASSGSGVSGSFSYNYYTNNSGTTDYDAAVEETSNYDTTTTPWTLLSGPVTAAPVALEAATGDLNFQGGAQQSDTGYMYAASYYLDTASNSGQTTYGVTTATYEQQQNTYGTAALSADGLGITYTATNSVFHFQDVNSDYYQNANVAAGTYTSTSQTAGGYYAYNSSNGDTSNLTASALSLYNGTTGQNLTVGTTADGGMGLTNGTSYVSVHSDSVVIHGGTSSTTAAWDNAGYHQTDSTNGLTFDVDNAGNVWNAGNSTVVGNLSVGGNASVGGDLAVVGNVTAASFSSTSGAYNNTNSAGGQSITWNDGTNYYYNSQSSSYNQLYWTDGSSSSVNTSDAGGTYVSNSSGNYAYLTTNGLTTNGTVSTNNLYANYANVGTADIGTANVTTANVTTANITTGNITTANVGTLAVSNGATISNGLTVNGGSTLNGGATVNGLLTANNGALVKNGLTVQSGGASVTGGLSTDTLSTSGNATIGGALAVTGNYTTTNGSITTTNGNITATNGTVTGAALVSTGTTSVGTNLTVGGTSDFRGAIFNGGTANGGALYVNDALTVTGEVAVGTIRVNPTTNKISGLSNATLSSTSTEAVTGQQLFATNTALATLDAREASHFSLLMKRADKAYQGVAMGFASNAAPLNLDNGEGGISAGVGVFQGEWAGAIRAQYVTDSGVGVGVNFGFSEDAVGGGVGASIKF